ncbi:DUF2080 family transposase-associated protein, partial [Aeromonas caviae]|uniref:DUF2080 family transposase-associated protein n=1 Tax=Aeromonas caviae TaxID=648 RepID=UPI001F28BD2D
IDVVEDHFVIKHEVRRKLLAGQKRRSYLKSRAAPGAYEGMVKTPGTSLCFTVPREGYIGWWRFWAIHRRATGVRFLARIAHRWRKKSFIPYDS